MIVNGSWPSRTGRSFNLCNLQGLEKRVDQRQLPSHIIAAAQDTAETPSFPPLILDIHCGGVAQFTSAEPVTLHFFVQLLFPLQHNRSFQATTMGAQSQNSEGTTTNTKTNHHHTSKSGQPTLTWPLHNTLKKISKV